MNIKKLLEKIVQKSISQNDYSFLHMYSDGALISGAEPANQ